MFTMYFLNLQIRITYVRILLRNAKVFKIASIEVKKIYNISEEHNMHKTFFKIKIFSWVFKTFTIG